MKIKNNYSTKIIPIAVLGFFCIFFTENVSATNVADYSGDIVDSQAFCDSSYKNIEDLRSLFLQTAEIDIFDQDKYNKYRNSIKGYYATEQSLNENYEKLLAKTGVFKDLEESLKIQETLQWEIRECTLARMNCEEKIKQQQEEMMNDKKISYNSEKAVLDYLCNLSPEKKTGAGGILAFLNRNKENQGQQRCVYDDSECQRLKISEQGRCIDKKIKEHEECKNKKSNGNFLTQGNPYIPLILTSLIIILIAGASAFIFMKRN